MIMNSKKLCGILSFLAMIALVAFPGSTGAEVYLEGFLGGVQPGNSGQQFFTRWPAPVMRSI